MAGQPKTHAKTSAKAADSEFRRKYEEKVAISPGLWFELHGAIEPKMGILRKSPELACTVLQQRKDEVVEYCLLNQIPCRLISLKARQDGSSTFSVGIAYRYLESMRATGCIIGGAHAQGTNLFRKLKVFAENDTFPRRVQTKVLDREARFGNGSLMEQLTASNPEAGRSGTYQVVVATEVARWTEEGVANAADILRTTWLIGKFHGVKAATGPTGSFSTIWRAARLRDGTMRP